MKKVLALIIFVIVYIFCLSTCSNTVNMNQDPQIPSERTDLRPLSADFTTRKAVAYSGVRVAGVSPSNADILEDSTLLNQGGWTLIRLFSSSEYSQRIIQVIKSNALDFKVMLGAWINGPDAGFAAANYAELNRCVALAVNPDYSGIIAAVSIGNETMVDWSGLKVPPADMAAYIEYARSRITQPVTTDDNWKFFKGTNESGVQYSTETIAKVVDFITIHTYPLADSPWGLWDWRQESVAQAARATAMMDAAISYAKSNYNAVKSYMDAHGYHMPIVVGETGWKSYPSGSEIYRAHPVNQKMYYDRLMTWRGDSISTGNGPAAIFYFEAFDEPWKESDDKWGLLDVNRLAKYVVYSLFPDNKESEVYTDADAVCYLAPVVNPPITKNRYVLYSDTIDPLLDAQPTLDPVTGLPLSAWSPWDGNTASVNTAYTASTSEGAYACEITPIPNLNWGWGIAIALPYPDDLSNFTASGYLNFSIKTTYAGKLEIGFLTGLASQSSACDVYRAVASGQYGYLNDGAWRTVSIPVSAITPYAAPAWGMPSSATLNMTCVSCAVVIADRYAITKNASGVTTKIYIDNIYWSK